jgi:hypothetical protein
MRRVKSHEPGQRVMTEAIAFLFTCKSAEPPSPEEFFALCRNLCTQTYNEKYGSPRRKVASRLLGGSTPTPFATLPAFLTTLEPLADDSLAARLIQAQNIGLQALITYTAFVDDDSEKSLKTHLAEPYLWFSNILYHDSVEYRTNCGGAALRFLQEGVVYLVSRARGKARRMSAYFDSYDIYKKSNESTFVALRKYLDFMLTN